MFVLQLNPMTSNAEMVQPIAVAETREALENYLKSERVEPYQTDGRWNKVFRQGGPLEWFNDTAFFDEKIVDIGTADEWAQKVRDQYDQLVARLIQV